MPDETVTETTTTETAPNTNGNPAVRANPVIPKNKNAQPRGKEIRIPVNAFKKRIEQEARGQAAQLVQKRLGISLDDAEAIIKKAQSTPGNSNTADANSVAADAMRKLQSENVRLKKEAEVARQKAVEADRRRVRDTQKIRDGAIESELRLMFREAGCKNPDYAIFMFQGAVRKDTKLQPTDFIKGLNSTQPELFGTSVAANTAPPNVPANTAARETQQSTGERPAAGDSAKPKLDKVDDMDGMAFEKHKRSKYGFSP